MTPNEKTRHSGCDGSSKKLGGLMFKDTEEARRRQSNSLVPAAILDRLALHLRTQAAASQEVQAAGLLALAATYAARAHLQRASLAAPTMRRTQA